MFSAFFTAESNFWQMSENFPKIVSLCHKNGDIVEVLENVNNANKPIVKQFWE